MNMLTKVPDGVTRKLEISQRVGVSLATLFLSNVHVTLFLTTFCPGRVTENQYPKPWLAAKFFGARPRTTCGPLIFDNCPCASSRPPACAAASRASQCCDSCTCTR